MRNNGVELILSCSRGVYIPQNFVEEFDLTKFTGISDSDIAALSSGPENDWYWDAWDSVLNNTKYQDENGNVWFLHQSEDLWMLCPDLMSNEDYENFFEEMKPAPDDSYEYHACENCLIALANDDYSDMDDEEKMATNSCLSALHAEYSRVIPDAAEYGFEDISCEICGALPSSHYRVICFK